MIAVIYTHPPDYLAAVTAARQWQSIGVRPILALDAGDPLFFPPGIETVRTTFRRNGNLNGTSFIREHLRLLRDLSGTDDEWAIKADSDALCFGLHWLQSRKEIAVGSWSPAHRGFYGFCYAVRCSVLGAMIAAADNLPDDDAAPEDVTIGELADSCGGSFRYEILSPGSPFAAFNWESEDPAAAWRGNFEVLAFQRSQGRGHREVSAKMLEFRQTQ